MEERRKISVFSVLVLIVALSGLGVGVYSLYNYQQLISQVESPKPLTRAFLDSSYAISGMGWEPVNFTVLDYDITSDFNITSDRFICPISGYYLISAMLMFSDMNDGEWIFVAAAREGILEAGSSAQASYNSSSLSTGFTDIVYLNESDYVEMFAYHSGSTPRTISGDSAGTYTYFTIAATDILN